MELNRIYKDDCIKGMQQMLSDGNYVDLIITDPPYLQQNGSGAKTSEIASRIPVKKIDFISKDFDYEQCFELMLSLQKIPNILIFCSARQISRTMKFFEDKGLSVTLLVWEKTNPIPLGNNKHLSDLEYIVYARGDGATFNNDVPIAWKKKLYRSGVVSNRDRIHPTQKGVEHIGQYIELHSKPNDVVLDCFMGSGTTAISAIKTKRRFIGFEIDDEFYSKATMRINNEQAQQTLF